MKSFLPLPVPVFFISVIFAVSSAAFAAVPTVSAHFSFNAVGRRAVLSASGLSFFGFLLVLGAAGVCFLVAPFAPVGDGGERVLTAVEEGVSAVPVTAANEAKASAHSAWSSSSMSSSPDSFAISSSSSSTSPVLESSLSSSSLLSSSLLSSSPPAAIAAVI